MPLIVDEPLGQISTAEAAALTIIRGVSPAEREQALSWFRARATTRELSPAVIRAIEKFVKDENDKAEKQSNLEALGGKAPAKKQPVKRSAKSAKVAAKAKKLVTSKGKVVTKVAKAKAKKKTAR